MQSAQQMNAALMQGINFTPDDLAVNRQGALTQAQQERLKDLMSKGSRTGLIAGLLVILITVGGLGYMILSGTNDPESPFNGIAQNAPLVIGVAAVILVFYMLMLVIGLNRSKNMAAGGAKVRGLTGKIKVESMEIGSLSAAGMVMKAAGGPTVSYKIKVGRDTIYTTDMDIASAFEPGATYRVYVIGNKPGWIIVSAEAVTA
jgi:hypothetical protein